MEVHELVQQIAMIVSGVVLGISGVLVVIFRARVARWNRRNLEARFGVHDGGAGKHSTPWMMGVVGCLFVVGAILLIARAH